MLGEGKNHGSVHHVYHLSIVMCMSWVTCPRIFSDRGLLGFCPKFLLYIHALSALNVDYATTSAVVSTSQLLKQVEKISTRCQKGVREDRDPNRSWNMLPVRMIRQHCSIGSRPGPHLQAPGPNDMSEVSH